MAILSNAKVAESLIISAFFWGGGRHLVAKRDWANSKRKTENNNRIRGIFVRYTR